MDRTPNSQISLYLGDQPHVERVTIANDGELDSTIRDVILGGYEDNNRGFWPFGGNGKKDDAIKPIVVFISTYYSYPELSGICNIIMYHDVM